MQLAALPALACPVCAGPLTADPDRPAPPPPAPARRPAVLGCPGGHRFDISRQGYVSLLRAASRTDTGDSADMVAARMDFLGGGHYAPIAAAIARAAQRASAARQVDPPVIVEIGAGTGYYLAAALDATPDAVGIAVDSSRFAARQAARDQRAVSVVADAWSRLPVADGAADVVLSVFAPRDLPEVARVLRTGGRFVAVTPEPSHHEQLRAPLKLLTVDQDKAGQLAIRSGAAGLTGIARDELRFIVRLTRVEVATLVRMGPTARHITGEQLDQRLTSIPDPVEVTVAVTISTFTRPVGNPPG